MTIYCCLDLLAYGDIQGHSEVKSESINSFKMLSLFAVFFALCCSIISCCF